MRAVDRVAFALCVCTLSTGCGRAVSSFSGEAGRDAVDGSSVADSNEELTGDGGNTNACFVPDVDGALIECPRDGGCKIGCYACSGPDAASCVLGHLPCFCSQGPQSGEYVCSKKPCTPGS